MIKLYHDMSFSHIAHYMHIVCVSTFVLLSCTYCSGIQFCVCVCMCMCMCQVEEQRRCQSEEGRRRRAEEEEEREALRVQDDELRQETERMSRMGFQEKVRYTRPCLPARRYQAAATKPHTLRTRSGTGNLHCVFHTHTFSSNEISFIR